MLIMPATTRDFHEMAAAVAADFFENGVPLVKGIMERAKSDQLVPEEVRRLTEKANTAAMLQLLKMEGRGKDIFSLARVEDVLALTHPTHEQSFPIWRRLRFTMMLCCFAKQRPKKRCRTD